ncbi:hypothetical protein DL764_010203 [Monosporascus ibericus]|uniref:DUF4939 domain-containing protein n=1 Tax=Monosporascus ibericus TaxID=155417 RepID=A0A4Q4ST49_9PEZI|nr:hypothetical protein DL764_010203 [Monosporascus ibericus]
MPPTTRGKGEPSSSQTQQPTPAPKDTIKVQGDSEKEEKPVVQEPQGPKGKERKLSPEEKMEILLRRIQALERDREERPQLTRKSMAQPTRGMEQKTPAPPLFGPNRYREATIPPPSYHGMPEIKGYKPITPKPYDGTTDVEGFLVQARTHLKFYQSSLTEDYQKVMAISQLLTGRVLLWFEPIMKDYLENYPKESSDITNYIFSDYRYFEDRMRTMFGDPDKEQHAVK